MDLRVGATERELVASVRELMSRIAPRIADAERAGTLPPEVIRELGSLGVLGMGVPEEDGGLGASTVAFALVLEEIASAWPSLAVGVSVNSGIVAGSIVRLGTREQRARWLPALMDGSGLGAFCLTEAGAGSDAAALRTSARRDGTGWLLDGEKLFVTNARYAPLLIVLARIGEAEPARPHAGITAFVVPSGTTGLSIGAPEKKMGLHASDTSAVVLSGARVAADAVLGEPGKGFGAVALAGLDDGRIGIAAQAIGIARGALDRAVAYSAERRQFGRPIGSFQAIRYMLASSRAQLDAARVLMLRAAWRRDRGLPFTREASMAKMYASEAAERICHVAVQVHGGYGYVREFGVERLARDARATMIYEGTNEIQRLVVARSLLAGATA